MSLLRLALSFAAVVLAALPVASHAAAGRAHARPVVQVGTSRYGRLIVDRDGRALYLFTRERHGRAACYGPCARAWPPYLAHGPLRAGRGLRRALLGTTRRRDGHRQITYAGHPLYHYIGDRQPGQVLCQDVTEFGGDWLVVHPDGTANRSAR